MEGTDGEQEIQGKQDEKGDDGMEESAADDEKQREAEEEEQKDVEMGNLVKERIAFIEAEEKRRTRGERGKWDYIGKEYGLRRGEAVDVSEGWDFTRQQHREAIDKYMERMKTRTIISRIGRPREEEHERFIQTLCERQENQKNYYVCEQKDKGATTTRWARKLRGAETIRTGPGGREKTITNAPEVIMEMRAVDKGAHTERSWEERVGCGLRRQLEMDKQKIKLIAAVEKGDTGRRLFMAKRQKGMEHEDETEIK